MWNFRKNWDAMIPVLADQANALSGAAWQAANMTAAAGIITFRERR